MYNKNKEEAKKLVTNALTAGRHALFEPEAKILVSAWGIQVPRSVLIDGLEDVALKSKEIIPPLVLKVVSQDILHKREFGGVITGINDDKEVSVALSTMKRTLAEKAPKARIAGFLLEETVPTGHDYLSLTPRIIP